MSTLRLFRRFDRVILVPTAVFLNGRSRVDSYRANKCLSVDSRSPATEQPRSSSVSNLGVIGYWRNWMPCTMFHPLFISALRIDL